MTSEPITLFRSLATLACLVGVPAIALVGPRGNQPADAPAIAPPARGAPAKSPPTRQPPHPNGQATDSEHRDVPSVAPTATIRGVAAADIGELTASTTPTPDLMTQQFQRLQALGATYYRLESAPGATAEFWFHCRVAGFDRPFEATDRSATDAVARVLAEIEAIGRRGPATAVSPASVYRR